MHIEDDLSMASFAKVSAIKIRQKTISVRFLVFLRKISNLFAGTVFKGNRNELRFIAYPWKKHFGYLWVICHHFFSPGIKLLLFNCIYNV